MLFFRLKKGTYKNVVGTSFKIGLTYLENNYYRLSQKKKKKKKNDYHAINTLKGIRHWSIIQQRIIPDNAFKKYVKKIDLKEEVCFVIENYFIHNDDYKNLLIYLPLFHPLTF